MAMKRKTEDSDKSKHGVDYDGGENSKGERIEGEIEESERERR